MWDLNLSCWSIVTPSTEESTCLNSTVETLKKGLKYVQNEQQRRRRCSGVFIVNFEHFDAFL